MTRRFLPLSLILSCGLIVLALASALAGPASAAAASTPIALGVNIENAPDTAGPLSDYEHSAGRNPAIVMWYQAWSEPLFYSSQLTNVSATGAVPMITWDPATDDGGIALSAIAGGQYDAYIRSSANAAAAWGHPMYIRFAHEMNLPSSPFGPGHAGDSAAQYVAAWRHVVSIFRQQGATNVQWVWSPNVYCGGSCPFTAFYPGDSWVDWVALDGYNYAGVDDVAWMSFQQIFGPSYAILSHLSQRPMMVGETASTEQGGNKAGWISQTFAQIPSQYPQIHAVIWFDRNKETDWRVDSSTASLQAWRQVVSSPQYDGSAATLSAIAPFRATPGPAASAEPRPIARAAVDPASRRAKQTRRLHQRRPSAHRRS